MTKRNTPIRFLAHDGNWMVHRAFYAFGGSKASEADLPKVIAMASTKVLQWCLSDARRKGATHACFAIDGGKSFRKDLYPLYKSNRGTYKHKGRVVAGDQLTALLLEGTPVEKGGDDRHALIKMPEPVDEAIEATMNLVSDWGGRIICIQGKEADDVLASIATLARRFGQAGVNIHAFLNTPDKDTLQALSRHATQTYPSHVKGKPDVFVRYGDLGARLAKYVHADAADWTPNQFLDFQVLVGDSTDSVPEIVRPAVARKIINGHGSLHAYCKTPQGAAFFESNKTALFRNVPLVRMERDLFADWGDEDLDEFRLQYAPPKGATVGRMLRDTLADYSDYVRLQAAPSLF